MAATVLTKSVLIMDFVWQVDEKVTFQYGDEDDPLWFFVSTQSWEDMGKPRSITVTIQPGDLLNP